MSFMFLTIGIVPLLVSTIACLPKVTLKWPLPKDFKSDPETIRQYVTHKHALYKEPCMITSGKVPFEVTLPTIHDSLSHLTACLLT